MCSCRKHQRITALYFPRLHISESISTGFELHSTNTSLLCTSPVSLKCSYMKVWQLKNMSCKHPLHQFLPSCIFINRFCLFSPFVLTHSRLRALTASVSMFTAINACINDHWEFQARKLLSGAELRNSSAGCEKKGIEALRLWNCCKGRARGVNKRAYQTATSTSTPVVLVHSSSQARMDAPGLLRHSEHRC